MKPAFKYALIFAALWIVLKIVLYNLVLEGQEAFFYGVMGNLLFILLTVFLTLWESERKGLKVSDSFLEDVKLGAQSGATYSLIVASFVFIYYTGIDYAYVEDKIEAVVEVASNQDYEKLRAENPEKFNDISHEEYVEQMREEAKTQYDPFRQATFSLLALVFTTLIYTFLITFLNRRIWSHFR